MLPPDGPFLKPALALLALPFRPGTAGALLPACVCAGKSANASCQAHNEAAPLSRSGSWVLLDLLAILLIFTLRFPTL